MKIWRVREEKGEKYIGRLEARGRELFSPALEEKVRSVVGAVARRGDRALTSLVRRHDLKSAAAASFRLHGRVGAAEEVDDAFSRAVETALANLMAFHQPQAPRGYSLEQDGNDLSIRVRPLDSVGVYVPGGAATYVSSLLMAVVPARIAGVKRIAVATPPRAFAESPHLRYLLKRLELKEVYLMGGAHAIAALAYGTESVTAVDKIVGPGGKWVAAAKRAVSGVVDIDMIAGPSELVVLADSHADPDIVAADLLAQAEHDPDAVPVLVTTSKPMAAKVEERLSARLKALPRGASARESVKRWGGILLAADLAEAVEVVNRLAPEHVEVLVSEPRRVVDSIDRAGAVYLGPWSPAVLGDYVVGSNHVLPTAGAARFASPLGVWDFVRRTAVVRVAAHRYAALAGAAGVMARVEGLPLHDAALRAGERGTL
ncbi:MAG: histidinol dehydrogenase [Acidobacteriota bacterium]